MSHTHWRVEGNTSAANLRRPVYPGRGEAPVCKFSTWTECDKEYRIWQDQKFGHVSPLRGNRKRDGTAYLDGADGESNPAS